MNSTDIAIIVVPRDRFSIFPQCIKALYEHTDLDFNLYVVAGGADPSTRRYLDRLNFENRNVTLILENNLLLPGEARNAALRRSSERYCVIVENDTLVRKGWLPPLLECMNKEEAAVVTPLVWWYRGIHAAGCTIEKRKWRGEIELRHSILYNDLNRKPIDYPENHCILIDRELLMGSDLFDDVEPFDVDLGLQLSERGLRVFFEPTAEVTYSPPPTLQSCDLELFKFRWSATNWTTRNARFSEKWAVAYDQSAKRSSYKRQYAKLGLARWYPTELTVMIANIIFLFANHVQMSLAYLGNWAGWSFGRTDD